MNTLKCIRMFFVLIGLTLALALPPEEVHAGRTQQTEPDFATIDAYVAEQVDRLGIPGLALGIVQDGRIAHLQGFGVADSTGRKVTPQTPFYLGSVTKSFTALAVMQLVEAGQIDLDAPVQTYLPWFELADKEASAQITVRHLLNQTTGISTKDGMRFWASGSGLEETVRGLNRIRLTQSVGTTYQYSNLNYITAGVIVEVVSGRPYADYVTEHIFEPLDMRHSYASRAPALADGMSAGHHFMFGRAFRGEGVIPPAYLPTGFLSASVEDLARYTVAHLNDGSYGDVAILSVEGMTQLHAPAIPIGEESHYAMGWNVSAIDGIPVIHHNGDTSRFRSFVLLMPERNSGIMLLANATGFEHDNAHVVGQITYGVFNLLDGKVPAPASIPFLMRFIYWAILLAPLLQVLVNIFVWRKRQGINFWVIGLAVALNLAFVFLMLKLSLTRLPLSTLFVYFPELGYTLIAVAALGIGWSVLLVAMCLFGRRLQPASGGILRGSIKKAGTVI